MGILSGPAIRQGVESGDIFIDPFIPENVGPNSYDLRLGDELLLYNLSVPLDVSEKNPTMNVLIEDEGIVLTPGLLYLASTMEAAGSDRYVPCIEGRSSMARLGISPHVSAGFGDHGFKGKWTLEITVTHHVRVFAGMRICQVFFHELIGDPEPYHKRGSSKYTEATGVQASMSHLDFK